MVSLLPNTPNPRIPVNAPPRLDQLQAYPHDTFFPTAYTISTRAKKLKSTRVNGELRHHWSATSLLWIKVFFFSLSVYAAWCCYNFFPADNFIATLSESLAATAGVMIGLSFSLSGLTYFFDLFDNYLRYRKQLGIIGYFYALTYSFTLLMRFPEKYGSGLADHFFTLDVLLGVTAMGILTFMAFISNSWGTQFFGKRWRPLLRMGYFAYGLLVIRALFLEGSMWQTWLTAPEGLPPARMLLTVFALSVICLRVLLQISLKFKKS